MYKYGQIYMASIFSSKRSLRLGVKPLRRLQVSNNPCKEQDRDMITEPLKLLGSFEGPLEVCDHETAVEQIGPVVLQITPTGND